MSISNAGMPRKEPGIETRNQRRWRKVYTSIGFSKGYNFPMFIILGGAMVGFCLARASYLDINTYAENGAPGEWFWYRAGHYRIGIMMHLASVVPGGILLVCQFVPIIRKKAMILHRINGYLVTILLLLACASGLMLCRRSFGGHVSTQAAVGMLAIMVICSLALAWYNIRRLQIDQHRAWMLRTAVYCGAIITIRIIVFIAAKILPMTGNYYGAMSCPEISTLVGLSSLQSSYPQCFNPNGTTDGQIAVIAKLGEKGTDLATVAIALQLNFGMAMWLGIFLHAIAVEIYLNLTPAESERLRMVSYEKQLEAGYKYPGSAGLTVDRWGDAPAWKPTAK